MSCEAGFDNKHALVLPCILELHVKNITEHRINTTANVGVCIMISHQTVHYPHDNISMVSSPFLVHGPLKVPHLLTSETVN